MSSINCSILLAPSSNTPYRFIFVIYKLNNAFRYKMPYISAKIGYLLTVLELRYEYSSLVVKNTVSISGTIT